MGIQKRNRVRWNTRKNMWKTLSSKEQNDTAVMGIKYLSGYSLNELSQEFGYQKSKIAYMICWLHGISSTRDPRFRSELRSKHRKAKLQRENASCSI